MSRRAASGAVHASLMGLLAAPSLALAAPSGQPPAAAGGWHADPSLVAGALGLALGIGVVAGWLAAMRRARAARAREAAAADARAREVVEERMVRRARTRSGSDLIVDALPLDPEPQPEAGTSP